MSRRNERWELGIRIHKLVTTVWMQIPQTFISAFHET